MDLSKIAYFLKAAELQNFTKAAEACNIAQTTMSKYINTLEEELGCTLFEREKKRVVLTSKGQIFYDGMQNILQQYRHLLQEVAPVSHQSVSLGIAIQDYLEIPVLREFEDAFPKISLSFSFQTEETLLEELKSGTVNGLILPDALALPEGYAHLPILKTRQSLVCSKAMLENYPTVRALIAHLPLITKTCDPGYHVHCQENFRQLFGVTCPKITVCKTLSEQLLQVGMSKGFAILPYSGEATFEGLRVIPLGEDFEETSYLVYDRNESSAGLRQLVNFIHEKKC